MAAWALLAFRCTTLMWRLFGTLWSFWGIFMKKKIKRVTLKQWSKQTFCISFWASTLSYLPDVAHGHPPSRLEIHVAQQPQNERLCRETWSEDRGHSAIVMQMWKVEATQGKRDEPRGSITLVFHQEPESICLKIKKGGRTLLWSAPCLQRTHRAQHLRLPSAFVYMDTCHTVSHLLLAGWNTETEAELQRLIYSNLLYFGLLFRAPFSSAGSVKACNIAAYSALRCSMRAMLTRENC